MRVTEPWRNLLFVMSLFVCCGAAQLQTIELRGEVKDQHGDVIVGATVVLSAANQTTRATVSNAQGRFAFTELSRGAYQLKIEAAGFALHEATLTLDHTPPQLSVTLKPTINDSLTVSDDPNAVALNPAVINGSLLRNTGTNPFNATLDANLSRSFGFGGKGKTNEQRYRLTFNARASNLLNRANLSGVDGVLNSPFFGRPNTASPARRIELGVRFDF